MHFLLLSLYNCSLKKLSSSSYSIIIIEFSGLIDKKPLDENIYVMIIMYSICIRFVGALFAD